MPSGALGDRLSRLPGVAECTVSDDSVHLVATPGTDMPLLRARAQAVCAGDRRALTVALAAATSGPRVVRPPSAALTRMGGTKAVALGSVLALGLIAVVPGGGARPAPLAAPAPLAVASGRPAPGVGTILGQALRLLGGAGGDQPGADRAAAVPVLEVASGLTAVAASAPATVRVPRPGRRSAAGPSPVAPIPPGDPPTPPPPAPAATPELAPTVAAKGKGKAKAAGRSEPVALAATTGSASAAAGDPGKAKNDAANPGNNGGDGKGHSK